MTRSIQVFAACDIGSRDNQEDAGLVLQGSRALVAAVFDGMGGHQAGEVAARAAAATVERLYRDGCAASGLSLAFRAANEAVRKEAARPGQHGLGTTAVALAIDANEAFVAHAGDSRCYRLRTGTLKQITEDHAPTDEEIAKVVAELRESYAGHSKGDQIVARYEARQRNTVHRALGTQRDESGDLQPVDVLPGDVYLLCSDGLNGLSLAVVAGVLADPRVADPARELVDAALALRDPGQDNVTAVVVRFA